ncbi:kelch repeat-containing protein [Streptomyces sp. NPDC048257]|uniref:Kelch repeat-containing protein n=1 Tax=Streptomyces sp. NPDC048257 TaxID=3365526 RepID=UPI003710A19D
MRHAPRNDHEKPPAGRPVRRAGWRRLAVLAVASLLALVAPSATAQGIWVTVPAMPTARAAHGVTAAHCPEGLRGTCVYAAGGVTPTGIAPFEAYSPRTNAWATLAQMKTPRFVVASTTAPCPSGVRGDCVYAVGGATFAAPGTALATAEAYSTETNTWLTLPNIPTARVGAAAATAPCAEGLGLKGTCVYVFGGSSGAASALTTVEAYSPATNTWATVTPLQTARIGHAGASGPCPGGLGLRGTCVYALGGSNTVSAGLASAEVYSPVLNAWVYLPDMPTRRWDAFGATSAPCPEGLKGDCVYALGGLDENLVTLDSMDAYSPVAGTWVTLPSMPTAHREFGAAHAPCPKNAQQHCVYAVGGLPDNGGTATGVTEAFSIELARVTQDSKPQPGQQQPGQQQPGQQQDQPSETKPKPDTVSEPAQASGTRVQAPSDEPATANTPTPAPSSTPKPAASEPAKPAPAKPEQAKPAPARPEPAKPEPVIAIGLRP